MLVFASRMSASVAERIWGAVHATPFVVSDNRLPVTVSIGVATAEPGQDLTPDQLVQRADSALYEAKGFGKNRARLAPTDSRLAVTAATLEDRINSE